jgi:hypothetical protein
MKLSDFTYDQICAASFAFRAAYAGIEQASEQSKPPSTFELLAMEREGVRRILEALNQTEFNPHILDANTRLRPLIDEADRKLYPKRYETNDGEQKENSPV